jgi:hypothetical protein
MTLIIAPVQTNTDKRAFYRFAHTVYRNDPHWVPHLWPQRKAYLDRTAAFFSYGEGDFWLARRNGRVVGTIGAAIDHTRNRDKGLEAAFFGFFEVLPDDYDTAAVLWDQSAEWARKRGMTELYGPHSFTVNDEAGFLVEGFDTAPAILMSHSPPYYVDYAERYGFTGGKESVAIRIDMARFEPEMANAPRALHRVAGRALERYGPGAVRMARVDDWEQEAERLHPVYNRSLSVLPEFSPMECAEFKSQAADLKAILDPELVLIAEVNGRVAGFGLGIPNVAEAFHRSGGLRYPWDYVRFALAQRRISGVSFKILAMDPDFWGCGLDAIMYLEMAKTIQRKGYTWVDASLTDPTNPQTIKLASRFGGEVYRRYREYGLQL